jgi:hypothetical protein
VIQSIKYPGETNDSHALYTSLPVGSLKPEMSTRVSALLLLVLVVAVAFIPLASAATYQHSLFNYANVFVDPNYVLSKNYSHTTFYAQQTILRWADDSTAGGPWSERIEDRASVSQILTAVR